MTGDDEFFNEFRSFKLVATGDNKGNILFWRTFMALVCHYMCILLIGSLSLKLGIITNNIVETKT